MGYRRVRIPHRAVLRARQVLAGAERQLTLRSPSTVADRLLSVFGLSNLVSPAAAAGA